MQTGREQERKEIGFSDALFRLGTGLYYFKTSAAGSFLVNESTGEETAVRKAIVPSLMNYLSFTHYLDGWDIYIPNKLA